MKEITILIPDNCELVKEDDVYKVKEIPFPRTWEEFCERYPVKKGESYIMASTDSIFTTNENYSGKRLGKIWCTSKEEAEAFLALMQLRRLREAWVKDFKFNWERFNYHVINRNIQGKLRISLVTSPTALSFPSREMAEDFFSCFKDLLEKAKIIL